MIVMIFILGIALLSLLFYTDNPYFFTTFSKFLSILFLYFFVEGHLKACLWIHQVTLEALTKIGITVFSNRMVIFAMQKTFLK